MLHFKYNCPASQMRQDSCLFKQFWHQIGRQLLASETRNNVRRLATRVVQAKAENMNHKVAETASNQSRGVRRPCCLCADAYGKWSSEQGV